MLDIINKGGLLMYPLLLCSLGALAVFIERLVTYKRLARASHPIIEALLKHGQKSKQGTSGMTFRMPHGAYGPVKAILENMYSHRHTDRDSLREIATETANREIRQLERHLGILSTITYIAPLIGLLGTVSGMIAAFRRIEMLSIEGKPISPGDLAGGIWEALVTTAAGLIIAIPAFIAYNYLVSLKQELVNDMEFAAAEMANILSRADRERTS